MTVLCKWVFITFLAFGIGIVFASNARAQSLDQLMGSQAQFSGNVTIACGDLQKSNCAQVLPHIAQYSAPQGLSITPIASKGTVQSAQGVCKGFVDGAIGQADAFAVVGQTTQCAASYDEIAQPLYPYYGYLVVLQSNSATSLNDLVNNVPQGKSIQIADGNVGDGGQITFSEILATDPQYKTVISEVNEDWHLALGAIQDKTLDGYFVMDSPGSPLMATINSTLDKNGKHIFKVLDVRPNDAFFNLTDWTGKFLYQPVKISGNWLTGETKTISVNAVLVVSHSYATKDTNAQAIGILRDASDKADAGIRAATMTPRDWTGQISN